MPPQEMLIYIYCLLTYKVVLSASIYREGPEIFARTFDHFHGRDERETSRWIVYAPVLYYMKMTHIRMGGSFLHDNIRFSPSFRS